MKCTEQNPLQRDGTSQDQRFLKALEPSYAKVHELSMHDWMVFAYNYAERVNYFNINDDIHPDGDWRVFFKDENEIGEYLKDIETRSDYEPHLALFLCFLKLLQFSQDHLNQFTGRHLKFYYERVLQLKALPATPEKVHVIFELAKNAANLTIPKNTSLDGGKDKQGKPITFRTADEITINPATIGSLKTIYHNTSGYNEAKKNINDLKKNIRYAPVTNSRDGLGTPFKKDEPSSFNIFGNESLALASTGFSIASPILKLSEGNRTIIVTIDFSSIDSSAIKLDELKNLEDIFQVYLTSEKGWIKPDNLKIFPPVDGLGKNKSNSLVLEMTINSSQKAIANYDVKIHGGNYLTFNPILKVLLESHEDSGYKSVQIFSGARVKSIDLEVSVTGMKNLLLENDSGKIDPSKPFFPFTPTPASGSGFYIGSEEMFSKNLSEIKLSINWKGVPDNLKTYYENYFQEGLTIAVPDVMTLSLLMPVTYDIADSQQLNSDQNPISQADTASGQEVKDEELKVPEIPTSEAFLDALEEIFYAFTKHVTQELINDLEEAINNSQSSVSLSSTGARRDVKDAPVYLPLETLREKFQSLIDKFKPNSPEIFIDALSDAVENMAYDSATLIEAVKALIQFSKEFSPAPDYINALHLVMQELPDKYATGSAQSAPGEEDIIKADMAYLRKLITDLNLVIVKFNTSPGPSLFTRALLEVINAFSADLFKAENYYQSANLTGFMGPLLIVTGEPEEAKGKEKDEEAEDKEKDEDIK